MKRLIFIVLLAIAVWQGYNEYQLRLITKAAPPEIGDMAQPFESPAMHSSIQPASQYKCDGRTRCSHMRSCAEATFFLNNCPGVEMDGDNDGIPCERQWCH